MRLLLATLGLSLALVQGCSFNKGNPDIPDTGETEDEADAAEAVEDAPASDSAQEKDTEEDKEEDKEDTAAPADTTVTVPDPTRAIGCEWIAGEWDMLDCAGGLVALRFIVGQGCAVQVDSSSPIFLGAVGVVANSALSLALPAGGSCHGFFDGTLIYGSCSAITGLCSYVAAPKVAQ